MKHFDPHALDAVRFPSPAHERILREAVARFAGDPRVIAMALTNSLARNVADAWSDLDFAVFVAEEDLAAYKQMAAALRRADPAVEVHMAATRLAFVPGEMDVNDLDTFEIRIGNFLAHARLIFDRDGDWHGARARLLPYYDEGLAVRREARFRENARYQAERCRIAVARGLAFEAAPRLVQGLAFFFACLFVKGRRYPVDYQKRIEDQARVLLGADEAVADAQRVLVLDATDPASLRRASDALERLLDRHL